jgi:hypothetical protein
MEASAIVFVQLYLGRDALFFYENREADPARIISRPVPCHQFNVEHHAKV